jgi:hypothetical protein
LLGSSSSLYLLARCYFLSHQYKRTQRLLTLHNKHNHEYEVEPYFLYLYIQSCIELKNWDDGLQVLSNDDEKCMEYLEKQKLKLMKEQKQNIEHTDEIDVKKKNIDYILYFICCFLF